MSARDIAARIMTPQEIDILNQACIAAGIDSSKIQPDNPFSKSGGTPSLLQAAVAGLQTVGTFWLSLWRLLLGLRLTY